ncbi:MAG: hypothetical protein KC708_27200, partial [Anaerolineae bacterium]|nr:hypothetical protein [Anaerolineae bacterium]
VSYGEGIIPTQWFNIGDPQTEYDPSQPLAVWDTSNLDGFYTVQVNVRSGSAALSTAFVYVNVDNIPPEAQLTTSEPGKVYRFPTDSVVSLAVTVEDNTSIDRVEFYRDGELIGMDAEWPYYIEVPIREPGNVTFAGRAYDQAGNSNQVELPVEIIRGG